MRVSCVNDSYCEGKERKLCAFFSFYMYRRAETLFRRRTCSSYALLYVRHTERNCGGRVIFLFVHITYDRKTVYQTFR